VLGGIPAAPNSRCWGTGGGESIYIFLRLSSGSTRASELDASVSGCADGPCLVPRPCCRRWARDACSWPISAAIEVVDLVPNGDLEEGTREEYGLAKEAAPEDEEVEGWNLIVRGCLSFLYQERS